MCRAFALGNQLFVDFPTRLGPKPFTQPQLFACLVVREHLQLSYRRAEVFLKDSPDWMADLDMTVAPDHNTLWRAFGRLLGKRPMEKALDLLCDESKSELRASLAAKPLTVDSTCYEPRHRSRHYDRACRKRQRDNKAVGRKKPGSWGKSVNRSRSKKLRGMPKLALAVAAGTHCIVAMKSTIGNGSDAPDFGPLLHKSRQRAAVKTVVADAGYDSEANHCIARLGLKVRSVIPPKIGRRSDAPPAGRFRRLMKQRFARRADAALYGQRSQSETVNSMMKRNLGECLRSIRPWRRKKEMALRGITHDLMLGP
jgi:hypothetical protein